MLAARRPKHIARFPGNKLQGECCMLTKKARSDLNTQMREASKARGKWTNFKTKINRLEAFLTQKWKDSGVGFSNAGKVILKGFAVLIVIKRIFGFTRVPVVISSEFSLERLLEQILYLLGIHPESMLMLAVLFRVTIITSFILLILPEIVKIITIVEKGLGLSKKAAALFLFTLYLVIILTVILPRPFTLFIGKALRPPGISAQSAN